MLSSTSMVDIKWVFDHLAGVQGPGTSKSFALGLWRDLFLGTVALIFGLHLGFSADARRRDRASPPPLILEGLSFVRPSPPVVWLLWILGPVVCWMGSLAGPLLAVVLSCLVPLMAWVSGVVVSEVAIAKGTLSGPAVFWWCELYIGMLILANVWPSFALGFDVTIQHFLLDWFRAVIIRVEAAEGLLSAELPLRFTMCDECNWLIVWELVNNSTVLALAARSSSRTVHATVSPNSNSDLNPPMVLTPQSPCPNHLVLSSPHGSEPQHRGDSPSINHVFMEDWSDDEDLDDEEMEYDSAEEDYAGGSKFFTSPVNVTPLVPVASPAVALPPTVPSPASAQTTAIASLSDALLPSVAPPVVARSTPGSFPTSETPAPVVSPAPAMSAPAGSVNGVVPLATTVSATVNPPESSPSNWRNLFASNRNTATCPKLIHYSAFTEMNGNLGHLTSTCPKSVPSTDSSKQSAHVSAPALNANTVKESIFNCLGPQAGSPVVVCPEANLPLNPTPILVEFELVSVSGDVVPVSGRWEILQSKRMRRQPSPPKHRARPSHVEHCTGQEHHAPVDSRDHHIPAPPSSSHILAAPTTNVLAG
ncbi:hypothetical protein POTOM_061611 [Populus tomentosa]|uniref:Uncharacterized protein n=1 Tax=Populus tomentosa TaxID=118781 RepID=A0A8X8BZL4_POPTO|nr:hypothetical protein POTOM_061611 [Populus tomentosa]